MKTSAFYFAALAFSALWLSSCATTTTLPRQAAFNEAEFVAYRHGGSGSISGQLVVTADGGAEHVGANAKVALFPVTAFTREIVDREIGNGEYLETSDPRFLKYVQTAVTDAHGDFHFGRLAGGEYFVIGLAQWTEGSGAQYQWACETVRVGGGQSASVKLSQNLHHPQRPMLVVWPLW